MTNPNNPVGTILTEAEIDAIVAAAAGVGAWILADEVCNQTIPNARRIQGIQPFRAPLLQPSGLPRHPLYELRPAKMMIASRLMKRSMSNACHHGSCICDLDKLWVDG